MPLFKKHKIVTLMDQLFIENCKLMFRIKNRLCPVSLCNLFRGNNRNYCTRNKNFIVFKHKLSIVNKSFLCKAVSDWTGLASEIKESSNKKSFVHKLKQSILLKY